MSVDDIEVDTNVEINRNRIEKLVSCIATRILGQKAERVSCKVLRKVLVKLGVKGHKGKAKKVWLELIDRTKLGQAQRQNLCSDVQRG